MDYTILIQQCIEQAEMLKHHLQDSCYVPQNCLGGEMLSEYETLRKHQLSIIKIIRNQLYDL